MRTSPRPSRTPRRHARRRSSVTAAALGTLALALGACSTGDGRELKPPTAPLPQPEVPDEPAPTLAELDDPSELDGATSAVDESVPAETLPGEQLGFELFTPWRDGAAIDPRHGCGDLDVSPPLAWSGVPDGIVELAITVVDQGAEGAVHWMVVGIDPSHLSTPEGGVPQGAQPLTNSFGVVGWSGPCPSEGTLGTYAVTVHALNQPVEGADELAANEALARIDELTIETASVTGTATG